MRRPRIAMITTWDSRARGPASGTTYYMARMLERYVGEVVHLGPIVTLPELWSKVRNRISRKLIGRSHTTLHGFNLARKHAQILGRRLSARIDTIFAPWGSTQIALLETTVPIVYLSDATPELIRNYYPDFMHVSDDYARQAHELEMLATGRSSVLLYPSQWAADSAIRTYHAPPDRVHILPFGANLDDDPPAGGILSTKSLERCHLLFLGKEWERKGGPLAYQTVVALRRRGMDAVLTVCGCTPPPGSYDPEVLLVAPPIDKNKPEDRAAMTRLLFSANFLLQPTRQELFGIAYCEASAHGTPSIATETGGVRGAISEGENGFLLPLDAGPEAYADVVAKVFGDPVRYRALVTSSRRAFESRLNWHSWGMHVADVWPALTA